MSGKSKKTTADKTSRPDLDTHQICCSAPKVSDRLSLSFYGEDTLKKHKQVILDSCQELEKSQPVPAPPPRTCSHSKKKHQKPKTPIIRIKHENSLKPAIYNEEKTKSRAQSRSSSRSSSHTYKPGKDILKYLNNRLDSSAKGLGTLQALMKERTKKL